jgi:hypothetical protein
MFNYFGREINQFGMQDWMKHHNPIVVLRNPLDRVVSSMFFIEQTGVYWKKRLEEFARHSKPYMHEILSINFRIINFYNLEEYIPRSGSVRVQSKRTNSQCDPSVTAEDVHVENSVYTLEGLERCVDIYNNFMANKERVTVDEWKELTHAELR